MKKKIMLFAMMIILIITGIYAYSNFNKEEAYRHTISQEVKEEIQKKNMLDELINVEECSEEFMEEYFDGMNEIQEIDNKDNLVIVTSKVEIEEDYGASKVVKGPNNQYFLQYDSEDEKNEALANFKKESSVVSATENIIYKTTANYNSWGIEATGLDAAINQTQSSTLDNLNEVTVAIIDSGCDITLFNKKYNGKIEKFMNVLDRNSTMYDYYGHGTHIAGTIAEGTPSNVKILPVKVSDSNEMYHSDIITGIYSIIEHQLADVINMSFGSYYYDDSLYMAIEAANRNNIICVAAAGNNAVENEFYPAAFDNTIAISSVDSNLQKSSFSNYGEYVTFAAPGTGIKSIMGSYTEISKENGNTDGEEYETIDGTSMATPHVASAVAILKVYNKDLTMEESIELLKRYSKDLGQDGHDKYYGHGLINFKGTEFYDGENGDEFNVFKKYSKIEVPNIEPTSYNYGSITNLMNAKMNFYYNSTDYYTKEFWELEGLEIVGYNPNEYNVQTIKAKYNEEEYTFTVDNTKFLGNGWLYTKNSSNEVTIDGLIGEIPPKVYTPQQIDGGNVKKLGDNVFTKQDHIKSVIVSEGVTEIGSTFEECTYLENVSLPNSLKIIGDYAFGLDASLKKIDIPSGVTTIGMEAFYLTGLETINIPGTITSIEDYAFAECSNLSTVTLNEGLLQIGEYAFAYTNIDEIIIPDSVKTIGMYAFTKNFNLSKVVLGKNVETIGDRAFEDCVITEVNIPEKLTTLSDYVFARNYIQEISIPDTVKTIEEGALYANYIIDVNLPNGLEYLGKYSLAYNLLKEINVPGSLEEIEQGAFRDNFDLTKVVIEEGVLEIGKEAFALEEYAPQSIVTPEKENEEFVSKNTKISKKESKIKSAALDGEILNREVDFPRSIEKFGVNAFKNNTEQQYKFYVYTNGIPHQYAKSNILKYICKDPNEVVVHLNKNEYKALETVESDDLYFELKYEDGRTEEIRENIDIKYINGEYLRGIDTYFTASAYNEYNEFVEKQVNVTVTKLTPKFEVPTDLVGEEGQTLSEVLLPDEFKWKNPDTIITDEETLTFDAIYTPEDTDNYEIVTDVKITISVRSRSPEKPEQVSIEGEYTYSGEEQTAIVIGFDSETMNIEGNKQTDAGVYTIKITSKTGKWSDRTKDPICLEWTINKKEIEVPQFTTVDIQWDGEEHSVIKNLDNKFNDELMEIEGITKATKPGKYSFEIKLKDSNNYKWQDDIEKVEFEWEISKVQIIPDITVKEKVYDGTKVLSNDNITISNLDSKDYTIISAILDSENIGHTKVKIKIRLSDEKFECYMLDNKLQESEYTLNIEVKAIKLLKPTKVNKVYTYNGKEQQIELNNFDADTMSIKNNTRKNAGKQTVVVSLKNSNYAWEDDNTQNDLEFNFEIEKAQIIITPDNITAKVGNAIPVIDKKAYTISGAFEENIVIPNLKISYEEEPDMTKEGIYNIVVTGDTEIENYKITYNTGTLTITNKDAQTITFKDKSSKTYGDEAFVNEVEGVLSTNGIRYSSSNEDVAIIDENGKITIKGIGTTIIKAIALQDNNYAEAIATYELVVNKLKLTKPTITKAYIYNEKEQTAEIDNNNSKYITVEGNKGKNAGEYLAIAKLIDKVNVSWEDETIDDIEIVWNIAKADPQITIPTDLWGIIGDDLEDIKLGEGFSWQENTELILGIEEYLAIYTPEDTDNYNIIENIPIKILTKMYNIEWLKDEKYTVIIEADYELFKHVVRVDGKEIEEDVDYISKDGSTKIILQEAFIDTLAPGEHTLEVDFKNGVIAKTTFKIAAIEDDNKENTDNTEEKVEDTSKDTSEYVKTGDSIKPIFVLLAISTLVFVITKKQLNKTKYKK